MLNKLLPRRQRIICNFPWLKKNRYSTTLRARQDFCLKQISAKNLLGFILRETVSQVFKHMLCASGKQIRVRKPFKYLITFAVVGEKKELRKLEKLLHIW